MKLYFAGNLSVRRVRTYRALLEREVSRLFSYYFHDKESQRELEEILENLKGGSDESKC